MSDDASPLSAARREERIDQLVARLPLTVRKAFNFWWLGFASLLTAYVSSAIYGLATQGFGGLVAPPLFVFLWQHHPLPLIVALVVLVGSLPAGYLVHQADQRISSDTSSRVSKYRAVRRHYLQVVERRYTSLMIALGPAEDLQPLSIAHFLKLSADPRRYERQGLHRLLRERRKQVVRPNAEGKSVFEALDITPQMVVLGEAVGGQSDILKQAMVLAARKALADASARIPIFISIHDLERDDGSISNHLATIASNLHLDETCVDMLRAELARGNIYLCLDDLRSADDASRRRLIGKIARVLRNPKVRCLISAQRDEYSAGMRLTRFAEWEIEPLKNPTELAEQVFAAGATARPRRQASRQASTAAAAFVRALNESAATSPDLADAIGKNPLFFMLAAQAYSQQSYTQRRFPFGSFAALYHYAIEATLKRTENDVVWRSMLLRELADVARLLHEDGSYDFTLAHDLIPLLIESHHLALNDTAELIKRMSASDLVEETAPETYRFRDDSYREYLTAEALARDMTSRDSERAERAWRLLWDHRHQPSWDKVVQYLPHVFAHLPANSGDASTLKWLGRLDRARRESDPGDLDLWQELQSLVALRDWSVVWNDSHTQEITETVARDWAAAVLETARRRQPRRLQRLLAYAPSIERLGDVALKPALATLADGLGNAHVPVRVAAAVGIGELHAPDIVAALHGPLQDRSWSVVLAAVLALGANANDPERNARRPEVVTALQAAAYDDRFLVQQGAAAVLETLEMAPGKDPLEAALRSLVSRLIKLPTTVLPTERLTRYAMLSSLAWLESAGSLIMTYGSGIVAAARDEQEVSWLRCLALALTCLLPTEGDEVIQRLLEDYLRQEANEWLRLAALFVGRTTRPSLAEKLDGLALVDRSLVVQFFEGLLQGASGDPAPVSTPGGRKAPSFDSQATDVFWILVPVAFRACANLLKNIDLFSEAQRWSAQYDALQLSQLLSSLSAVPVLASLAQEILEHEPVKGERPAARRERQRSALKADLALLIEALRDPSVIVRGAAVAILSVLAILESTDKAASFAQPVIPLRPLLERLNDRGEQIVVRVTALAGLTVIGCIDLLNEKSSDARLRHRVLVEPIQRRVGDASAWIRGLSLLSLSCLLAAAEAGPHTRWLSRRIAWPRLRRAERDRYPLVRLLASIALALSAEDDARALESLQHIEGVLREDDSLARLAAVSVLGIFAYEDGEAQNQQASASSQAASGERLTEFARHALAQAALTNDNLLASIAALSILALVDPGADALVRAVRDVSVAHKVAAIFCLQLSKQPPLDVLVAALGDQTSAPVRMAAGFALRRVLDHSATVANAARDSAGTAAPVALAEVDAATMDSPRRAEGVHLQASDLRAALEVAARHDPNDLARAASLFNLGASADDDVLYAALADPAWMVRLVGLGIGAQRLTTERLRALAEDANTGVGLLAAIALEQQQAGTAHSAIPESQALVIPAERTLQAHSALVMLAGAAFAPANWPLAAAPGLALGVLAMVDAWGLSAAQHEVGRRRSAAIATLAALSSLSAIPVQGAGENTSPAILARIRDGDADPRVHQALDAIVALRLLRNQPPDYPGDDDLTGQALFDLNLLVAELIEQGLPVLANALMSNRLNAVQQRVAALLSFARWDVQVRAAHVLRRLRERRLRESPQNLSVLPAEDQQLLGELWAHASPTVRDAAGEVLALLRTEEHVSDGA
jgi:hypothetical protein